MDEREMSKSRGQRDHYANRMKTWHRKGALPSMYYSAPSDKAKKGHSRAKRQLRKDMIAEDCTRCNSGYVRRHTKAITKKDY